MNDAPAAPRPPALLIAIGAAAVILAAAAVLSGPILGPPTATHSLTPARPTATPDTWAALRRPFAFPPLNPDASCSASMEVRQGDAAGLAPLPGDGPIYPLGAFQEGHLFYDVATSRWDDVSLLWISREGQAADALVRGERLDVPAGVTEEVGFGDAEEPAAEMHLERVRAEPFVPGWVVFRADVTRVKEPGCYGVQIDTTEGSSVVVFAARPSDEALAELLRRPIVPTSAADAECSKIESGGAGAFTAIVGPGPAYLAWSPRPISFANARAQGDWRVAVSAPWVVDARDRGPLVVRSATDRAVAFDGSSADEPTMQGPVGTFISTPGQPPGWRTYFADILVRGPGCYVLQVDLLTASYAFAAFEVVP